MARGPSAGWRSSRRRSIRNKGRALGTWDYLHVAVAIFVGSLSETACRVAVPDGAYTGTRCDSPAFTAARAFVKWPFPWVTERR